MIRFYKTPWITRVWYPSFKWKIQSNNSIYLTFDDGPDPEVTPWVLAELAKVQAKATFFCLGKNLEKHPTLGQHILKEGHQIGNHTFNHLKGWKSSDNDYLNDIAHCDQQLNAIGSGSKLFRPPYGRIKKKQIQKLHNKTVIMWSHLSWDFDPELNTKVSMEKLKNAKPGSILVFHDSAKAFENLKQILPKILSHFKAKGLKFEAIS
jgi:peptidoglycan/xylan/chitin deacetylase (PgdA/CDA1 family)